MSVSAPPGTEAKIVGAAKKAGVQWVMPTCYGTDIQNETLARENLHGAIALRNIKTVADAGINWVALVCSFWYEFSLSVGADWYGFDIPNKKVTFYDDGNTRINTSTWRQCGRALASLLSLKELPEDENDTSPTLSNWRNKGLYISSFLASQRDMLDSLHRVLGDSDADWTIETESTSARYARGQERMKEEGAAIRSGFGLCLYARTFYPNGDGNFEAKHGLANEVLGLPKEDIDEATARAVEISKKSGGEYNPAKA
ncbi:hypothetical protein VHEMI09393 [[Torrubiella] hemipterigena]|uniref:NmrA-like domain-containing protein n=1 Tax=[Torrubiella] hemipterigena TaxID=1531966 RepID=A0A0A1T9S9_9HYPO|nr:hypothetical protein VHEMI09393 [[Torrubiella] hemipterigena]